REAEAVCDRIAILVKGRVRQVGTVSDVRRWGMQDQRFRLDVTRWPDDVAGVEVVANDPFEGGRRVIVSMARDARLNDVLRQLLARDVAVLACDRLEPDLEEAFARILESEAVS